MSSSESDSFPSHRAPSGAGSESVRADDGERMPIPSSLSRFVLRTSVAAFAEMVDCAPPHSPPPGSVH